MLAHANLRVAVGSGTLTVSVLRVGPEVLMVGHTPVSSHVALVVICCGCAAVPILDHDRAAGVAGPMRSLLATVPTAVGEPQRGGGALAQWPQLGMATGGTAMEPGMLWLTFGARLCFTTTSEPDPGFPVLKRLRDSTAETCRCTPQSQGSLATPTSATWGHRCSGGAALMSALRTRWGPRGPSTMASAGAEDDLPIAGEEEEWDDVDP